MPDSKKKYGLPIGRQGSMTSDPVTELMRQNQLREQEQKLKRQSEIDGLKHLAEKKELEGKLSEEDKKRMAELEKEMSKTKEELAAERQRVLENKIEEYQKQILAATQGDPRIKEMEKERDEARRALDQERVDQLRAEIAKLREEGGLDINKELEKIEPLMEKLGYKKEAASGEIPPDIWLRIKQMELDQQRETLTAESEREDRRDARELEKLKWQEEKEMKLAQIQAEIAAKKEGNQLLAAGVEKLGEVLTAAKGAGVGGAGAGAVASRVIDAGEGEAGEIQCPVSGCGSVIPISKSATNAVCAGCGTPYTINRIAKAATVEEVPVSEE